MREVVHTVRQWLSGERNTNNKQMSSVHGATYYVVSNGPPCQQIHEEIGKLELVRAIQRVGFPARVCVYSNPTTSRYHRASPHRACVKAQKLCEIETRCGGSRYRRGLKAGSFEKL